MLRVEGSGFGVWGLGFRVQDLGFRVKPIVPEEAAREPVPARRRTAGGMGIIYIYII